MQVGNSHYLVLKYSNTLGKKSYKKCVMLRVQDSFQNFEMIFKLLNLISFTIKTVWTFGDEP